MIIPCQSQTVQHIPKNMFLSWDYRGISPCSQRAKRREFLQQQRGDGDAGSPIISELKYVSVASIDLSVSFACSSLWFRVVMIGQEEFSAPDRRRAGGGRRRRRISLRLAWDGAKGAGAMTSSVLLSLCFHRTAVDQCCRCLLLLRPSKFHLCSRLAWIGVASAADLTSPAVDSPTPDGNLKKKHVFI
ncbi:hypothetical protein GUJ93_ZPchr0001g31789 [Zizania palustris]|uniref:Uncharacterized protein n=1 Tax=Zizania palustris TaxID=103762 RepID=A0A8J5RGE7_ZIZPA|nr:hypothetical protein GUJ93_ZPchr0001g31789 [Zizania palustris]